MSYISGLEPFSRSGGPKDGELDGSRLSRPWFTTPLVMTLCIIVTLCLVTELFAQFARFYVAPVWPVGIGLVIGLCGMGWGHVFAAGARETVSESLGVKFLPLNHSLSRRVAALAQRINLPPPAVGVTGVSNAFAVGTKASDAAVVIGTPLIDGLRPEELDAIIGHELGHIASGDMRRMLFAEGYQSLFSGLFSFFTTVLVRTYAKSRTDLELGVALSNLGRITLFVASELVVKGVSRSREYFADAVGAALTSKETMVSALEKLHGVTPTPVENRYGYLMARGSRLGGMFSTHPTFESRRDALLSGRYLNTLPRK